jgi:hypothetical protein
LLQLLQILIVVVVVLALDTRIRQLCFRRIPQRTQLVHDTSTIGDTESAIRNQGTGAMVGTGDPSVLGDSPSHETHRRSPRQHRFPPPPAGAQPFARVAGADAALLLGDSPSHETRRRSPRQHRIHPPPAGVLPSARAFQADVVPAGDTTNGYFTNGTATNATATSATAASGPAVGRGRAAVPTAGRPVAPTAGRAVAAAAGRAAAGRAAAPAAGRAATGRATRPPAGLRNRGSKYLQDEIDSFLNLLEDNLPIGPQEWDDITEAHNNIVVSKNRDSSSLRRKFNELVQSKKPTGDPFCPPHIRRAKQIYKMILAKSESGGTMLEDEEIGFDVGADDNFNEEDTDTTSVFEPQNLFPALERPTTGNNNTTVTMRSMVTPRSRRTELAASGHVSSLMDIMVANMMERQQIEAREREERREERKMEQEERRLDRAQQQQQTMMMMMAFARMDNRHGAGGAGGTDTNS